MTHSCAKHIARIALVLAWASLSALYSAAWGQTGTVRGFVADGRSGEPLPGVNVAIRVNSDILLGATTDGDGIYSVSRIPPGQFVLRATYLGYEPFVDTVRVDPGRIEIRNIRLVESTTRIDEVVVEADYEGSGARVTAGLQQIRPSDIDRIPTPDVSGDLVTFLTTQPGVISMGDRGGQLFVRGGEPSHNLVLLDGMVIHQPFHILGFYSAFPSDVIGRADFYSAAFGAPFGGRTASVLDIYSRNGNKRRFEGAASIAPFVSSLQIEGPLQRDKISFLASGRQSVIEHGAGRYMNEEMPYRFGDVFGKVHYIINDSHQLAISAIHTYDRGTMGEESEDRVFDEIRWSNDAIGLRYIVLPRNVPFVAEVLVSWSQLKSELGPLGDPVRRTRFGGYSYAVNMTNFIRNVEWKWGLFWRAPEISSLLGGAFQNVEFGFSRRHKAGLYVEPNIRLDNGLSIRAGLISQIFAGQADPTFIEPRLRLLWDVGRHQFTAGAGRYHQEVFGLNDRRDAMNIYTSWRSAPTENLSQATHFLAGYRLNAGKNLEVSIEGYHKVLSNLYISEWTSYPRFTSRLQRAKGRASGVDVRAEYTGTHLYASANYGLSFVRYKALQSTLGLWYGAEELDFRPPHDRRHQINLLAGTQIAGFDINLRWNYGSGRPYNRIYGFDGFLLMHGITNLFEQPDEQRVIYERPFQGVLPDYHRLDFSVERTFDLRTAFLTVHGSVINVYDRRNLFALDIFTGRRSDQLPVLPSAGIKVGFR